jgi:hypothetical protein
VPLQHGISALHGWLYGAHGASQVPPLHVPLQHGTVALHATPPAQLCPVPAHAAGPVHTSETRWFWDALQHHAGRGGGEA